MIFCVLFLLLLLVDIFLVFLRSKISKKGVSQISCSSIEIDVEDSGNHIKRSKKNGMCIKKTAKRRLQAKQPTYDEIKKNTLLLFDVFDLWYIQIGQWRIFI